MNIGERIKQQRKFLNIKQEELSKYVGVSLKTVQRWEAGERSPRVEEINKVAEKFGITPEQLLEDDSDEFSRGLEINTEKQTKKDGMATISFRDGNNISAPATPEGYAFLKEIYLAFLHSGVQQAVVG